MEELTYLSPETFTKFLVPSIYRYKAKLDSW